MNIYPQTHPSTSAHPPPFPTHTPVIHFGQKGQESDHNLLSVSKFLLLCDFLLTLPFLWPTACSRLFCLLCSWYLQHNPATAIKTKVDLWSVAGDHSAMVALGGGGGGAFAPLL